MENIRDLEKNEFNHLRVSNIDEFLEEYGNNNSYYNSPFEILYELEKHIKFKNDPDKSLLIPYKEWGDIIFVLSNVYQKGRLRIVEYYYDTSIS